VSWRDAPLYVEAHDLARWLLERTGTWPADTPMRSRLGEAACELLEGISLALTFPGQRAGHLQQTDAAIVRVRVLLRLARDLGLVSAGGVRFAGGRLRVIGRMVGGWSKRVQRSRQASVEDHQNQGAGHPASGA
jgi:hypothetical protein